MAGSRDGSHDRTRAGELLRTIVPFRFLSVAERTALAGSLDRRTVSPGTPVYQTGDEGREVYLLAEGTVETIDIGRVPEIRINRIEPGHYFGERAALFDTPREYTIRSIDSSTLYVLPGDRFLDLVHESRAFAQSLGSILREKQGIFDAFDRFVAELTRGIGIGSIDVRRLLPMYRVLDPALHPGANSSELDFQALNYAVSRLPENVTRTFIYLLTDDLPFEFSRPDETFSIIASAARRRNIWEMLPGKSMVLLRNGLSDLLDFVTCLCVYAVEALKIRKRVADPALLASPGTLGTDRCDLLEGLPLSRQEQQGLRRVWPGAARERIEQIIRHREVIHLDIRRQTQEYNSRRTDLWTHQISAATRTLLDCDPAELPESVSVHVISSNTHSVTNCLTPSFVEHADRIIAWGEQIGHEAVRSEWNRRMDLVYALGRDYYREHPGRVDTAAEESAWGMLRLRETVSTGIEVQLIDMAKLKGAAIDPDLGGVPGTRALLVNIDYAFGEQAEEIIRNLIMLFGRRLSSINVLGKAGALVGVRGDVLVPTAFIEQSSDGFYPLVDSSPCNTDELEDLTRPRRVHRGPLLTVSGTLLQNNTMLHFYRHIWDCIGLEMEGTHYFRQIVESQQLGVISRSIPLRFLYYVSDLPLDRSADLSARLSAAEGIPPLYAITRQIVREIFGQERRNMGATT